MATMNKYFNSGIPASHTPTQRFYENLIIQSIKVTGVAVYYIPRDYINIDSIFLEDSISRFSNAIKIEMHLDDIQGFSGNGSFMSRFGVEINDTCSFTVSKSRWIEEVGRSGLNALPNRPTEGSLIFFPMTNTLFQITKVSSTDVFYQLGKLFTFKLDCETYQYSSEEFETGITEIDKSEYTHSTAEEMYLIIDENGLDILLENGDSILLDQYSFDKLDPGAQNKVFFTESDKTISWNEMNPFAELGFV